MMRRIAPTSKRKVDEVEDTASSKRSRVETKSSHEELAADFADSDNDSEDGMTIAEILARDELRKNQVQPEIVTT